jgi:hypothetical protein
VLEIAIIRSKAEIQGTKFDKCNKIMAHADDVVITGRILQNDGEVFTSFIEKTNKMGSEINEKKTKFIIVSQTPYNENEYVKLGTHNFAIVKNSTYLGTLTRRKIRRWFFPKSRTGGDVEVQLPS